jgi:hypothetical protein
MLEKNKSLWRNFLSNLNDPNVKQAIMTTGVNLLRSPQYGQNSGDVIANALGTGVQTLQGLRNLDYQKGQATQARTDKLGQQSTENQQGQQRIDISRAQQGTYQQQVESQANATNMNAARENAQISESARHNQVTEGIQSREADAAMVRAKAYGTQIAGKTPQDIQKINILAAQYMAEGMDETAARANAVMVVETAGKAKSPGEQARLLYEAKLKNWQGDIGNFGKSLTPQQAEQMLNESLSEVTKFSQFNASQTGAAPLASQRGDGAPASTPGTVPAQGESPVGTIKAGHKKTKKGPDADKTTWTQVTSGNTK